MIDHTRYSYWGGLRAVVVQFSRGCPHLCSYCGQRGFWTRWRHRDPVRFAAELARLYREHGVRVINFADENPTVSKKAWRSFLEALIAENVPLILVGSTRADDIVRDADMLHLYKRAGWVRFLLGLENTDARTLNLIRKGADVATDREAIRLLRRHGIISMATWVVGFEEETDRDYWRGLRQLMSYDPDQIQLLYVTPHRWTPYFRLAAHRMVIQTDRRRWDYKHQVLATRHMPPWRVLLWFKFIEMVMQTRPSALYRVLLHPDRGVRHAMRWYTQMGRRVWPYEIRKLPAGSPRTERADSRTVLGSSAGPRGGGNANPSPAQRDRNGTRAISYARGIASPCLHDCVAANARVRAVGHPKRPFSRRRCSFPSLRCSRRRLFVAPPLSTRP